MFAALTWSFPPLENIACPASWRQVKIRCGLPLLCVDTRASCGPRNDVNPWITLSLNPPFRWSYPASAANRLPNADISSGSSSLRNISSFTPRSAFVILSRISPIPRFNTSNSLLTSALFKPSSTAPIIVSNAGASGSIARAIFFFRSNTCFSHGSNTW